MSKKMMIVTGSPRKGGNTAKLASWVAEGAKEAGAEVEIIDAAHLKYKTNGCTACMGCQQSEEFKCIIKDEASDIIARIPEQNVLILASPVYFMGFSAQIKLFLDRMFSLFKISSADNEYKHCLQNTDMALIAVAGGDEGSGLNLIKANMDAIAGFMGKKAECFTLPFAPEDPGELDSNLELKDKAYAFGAELVG